MDILAHRTYRFICCSIFLLSVLWCGLSFATTSQNAKGEIRFAAIYIEEPPFIYSNAAQGYNGIVPSLMTLLSQELNLNTSYVTTSRNGLEDAIITNRADVTWLSPEWVQNKDKLLFSSPILLHNEFLYSLSPFEQNVDVDKWVKGKTICVRQDYQYPSLELYFNRKLAHAVRVSSQVPLVSLLLKKRCDLLYMNEHRASWMINSLGVVQPLYRSPESLAQTHLSLVVSQRWQSELTKINQALSKIKTSGQLAELVATHINSHQAQ